MRFLVTVIHMALHTARFDKALIDQYAEAVRAAFAAFGGEPSEAEVPMTVPLLPKSRFDKATVVALLGIGGPYGTVEAATPADLQEKLLAHLRTRFAAPNDVPPSGR